MWAEGKMPLCVGENTKDNVLTSVANHCVFLKDICGTITLYFPLFLFLFLLQMQSADIRIYVRHSVSVTYSSFLKNHDMRMDELKFTSLPFISG